MLRGYTELMLLLAAAVKRRTQPVGLALLGLTLTAGLCPNMLYVCVESLCVPFTLN